LQGRAFEFRQRFDATVGQDILAHRQRALFLVNSIALDDARAAELALVLLVAARALVLVQEGIQLLFDVHETAMKGLAHFLDRVGGLSRGIPEHGHPIVCVGYHAQSSRPLNLVHGVIDGVNAAARGQEVSFVGPMLSLSLAQGLVEGLQATGVLAYCLGCPEFFIRVDPELGGGVAIVFLARLRVGELARGRVAAIDRVSALCLH